MIFQLNPELLKIVTCRESPLSSFPTPEFHVSIILTSIYVSYMDLHSTSQVGRASHLTTEMPSQSHKSLFVFRRLAEKNERRLDHGK